jgi:hypothetical protein
MSHFDLQAQVQHFKRINYPSPHMECFKIHQHTTRDGWMDGWMDDGWTGNIFSLCFKCLVNHIG